MLALFWIEAFARWTDVIINSTQRTLASHACKNYPSLTGQIFWFIRNLAQTKTIQTLNWMDLQSPGHWMYCSATLKWLFGDYNMFNMRAHFYSTGYIFLFSQEPGVLFFSFQNTVLILGEIPQLNTIRIALNPCEQWPLTSGNAKTAFIQAHSLKPTEATQTETIYRKDNILIDDFHFAYLTNGLEAVLSCILGLTWKIHKNLFMSRKTRRKTGTGLYFMCSGSL